MYVVHPIHGLRPPKLPQHVIFFYFQKWLQSATFIVAIFSSSFLREKFLVIYVIILKINMFPS